MNICSQNKFRKKIYALIKKSSIIAFYDNNYNNYINKNIQSIIFVKANNLEDVKNIIIKNNFINIINFEDCDIKGFYFEYENKYTGLIFALKYNAIPKQMDLDINIHSKLFINLKKIGIEYKLKFFLHYEFFPFYSFYKAYYKITAYLLNLNINKYYIKLYENSFNKYINYFSKYLNTPLIMNDILSEKKYNHIKAFACLYIWIAKVLSNELKNNTERLTIHDVGTELAFLPLMLSYLSGQKKLNLNFKKIFASDLNFNKLKEFKYIKFIKKNKIIPIQLFKYNLNNSRYIIPKCDITTAIDVIEHLPNEKIAFNSIKKLWDHTKKIMIIHVPYDKKETKWHDHNMIFNQEKTKEWASNFKDAIYLSESYKETKDRTLCDLGFLILLRKNLN